MPGPEEPKPPKQEKPRLTQVQKLLAFARRRLERVRQHKLKTSPEKRPRLPSSPTPQYAGLVIAPPKFKTPSTQSPEFMSLLTEKSRQHRAEDQRADLNRAHKRKGMSRSGFIVIAIVVALAVFAYSSTKQTREARNLKKAEVKAEAETREFKLRAIIADFVKRNDADLSWMPIVEDRTAPLYSVDLEKAWLIDRPIVFAGALANVATENDADYQLTVRQDFLSPDLRLQLLCAKDRVAPILAAIKSNEKAINGDGIVVAAKIARLAYLTERDVDLQYGSVSAKTVFVGHGRCVDIVHLGDTFRPQRILRDMSQGIVP